MSRHGLVGELRRAHRAITDRLLAAAPPRGKLLKHANRVGIRVENRVLHFGSEIEMALLLEHHIYDHRPQGKSPMELFLKRTRFEPGSIEAEVAGAMRRWRFSVFRVERVFADRGVELRDVLADRRWLLVDLGFGATAAPDLIMAGRILPFEDFAMATGTMLPATGADVEALMLAFFREHLDVKPDALKTAGQRLQSAFATVAVRTLLGRGASAWVDNQAVPGVDRDAG